MHCHVCTHLRVRASLFPRALARVMRVPVPARAADFWRARARAFAGLARASGDHELLPPTLPPPARSRPRWTCPRGPATAFSRPPGAPRPFGHG
eukprot:7222738-Lingulodinium_polyedra.AAC.1